MAVVSVIIPVHNTESYLSKCLNSILMQTLNDIEILCIDDGSTDCSMMILEQYAEKDKRIKVFHKNNCEGVFNARKLGIQNAASRYVSFVDSDDWIEPDMLEILVNTIGNADLVSCGFWRELPSGQSIKRVDGFSPGLYQNIQGNNIFWKRMIYDLEADQLQPLSGNLCNKLFHREKLNEFLSGECSEKISLGEDALVTYLYVLRCTSIVVSHQCLYHYCYREMSTMHRLGIANLVDTGRLYNALFPVFEKSVHADALLPQLQKWITLNACHVLNLQTKFAPVNIPEFIIDTEGLQGKRIALYGAGKAGNDIYKQLNYFGYDIVIWADRNYKNFVGKYECVIESPLRLLNVDYDIVLLAAGSEKLGQNMRDGLNHLGISNHRIQWRKPLVVY